MLIIEDGTIVANANSYTTDAEFVAYAALRGLTIPALEADRDTLQILASDWAANKSYQGLYVDADNQYLPFPRSDVYAYGRTVDSATIPKELKRALMEAAIAASTHSLLLNETNQNVTKQKVDVIEVEFGSGGAWKTIRVGRAMNYLQPFLVDNDQLART
jgi:hypothetical protein